MSTTKADHESQELVDLRNELLSGLNKKKPRRSDPTVLEEDKELEKLRLEALNAKRASLEGKSSKSQTDRLPARFRYRRRDSQEEQEEDDESDYCLLPSISIDDLDENNDQQLTTREDRTTTTATTTSTQTFKSNYEVYKRECSKLMAHDAYDPASDGGESSELRLKNLRERVEHKLNNGNNGIEPYDPVGDQDLVDLDYEPMRKENLVRRYGDKTQSSRRNRSYGGSETTLVHDPSNDDHYYSSSSNEENDEERNSFKKLRSVIIVPVATKQPNELSNSRHSPVRQRRSRSKSGRRSGGGSVR